MTTAARKSSHEALLESSAKAREELLLLIARRVQLFSNGYRVVPVLTGEKRPADKAWTDKARLQDPEDLRRADSRSANTGVLCDGLQIVDIDCDDPGIAAKIRLLALNTLGPAPVRTRGNSPRSILVYRALRGRPPKRRITGTMGTVEILGRGQQFVAFGLHPSGVEFKWPEGSPLEFPVDRLTTLSEEQIDSFFANLRTLIKADVALPRKFMRRLHESERNDGLTKVGGALRRKGKTYLEIEKSLLKSNMQQCEPPLDDAEVERIAASAARYPAEGPDILEIAWTATTNAGMSVSSRYEKFLSLCRSLHSLRNGLAIVLPLERIAELFGRDYRQIGRWRSRAVRDGFLIRDVPYIPHIKAASYLFIEYPTKAKCFSEET